MAANRYCTLKPAVILFEVMCVVLLVSLITVFVFKAMSRSAKAIHKSQDYFSNLEKANDLYWQAYSVFEQGNTLNLEISSLADGEGTKLDLISSVPTKNEVTNEES